MSSKVPLISGTNSVIVDTFSKEQYDTTIAFYSSVLVLDSILKGANKSILSNKAISVEIRLTEDSFKHREALNCYNYLKENINTKDWRGCGNSIVFSTPNIMGLQARLELKQSYPCAILPMEVYTLDPQGNILGFTDSKNGMATLPIVMTDLSDNSNILKLPSFSKDVSKTDLCCDSIEVSEDFSSVGTKICETSEKAIAVMTSGGDAPGMNANVRAIVRTAISRGCRAFTIMEGYEGLIRGGPEYIRRCNWEDVRGWTTEGGTNIGTAFCEKFFERSGRLLAAQHLIEAGVSFLIVCGGDGSLTGANLFKSEWPSLIDELLETCKITKFQFDKYQHLNICGVVCSIENDVSYTDATVGAYSSLDRVCQVIDYIEATANSHSRAFVVEVMGKSCGWLALMAGISTSADYILIPEKPSSSREWQDQMCDIVSKHRARGKRTTVVIVAEGAISADLSAISSKDVHKVLSERLGLDTRITTLGNVQRGGTAVAFDRILATLQGVEAVNVVLESKPDTPPPLIAINENKITRKLLVDSIDLTKSVENAIKKKDFKKAMELRGPEFVEHLNNFMAINSADHNEPKLPIDKRLKIVIINIGAPAGGINSAVYSMATYCMFQGHKPYAIYNGWTGLVNHESVHILDWKDILGWQSRGGSELGTNRTTPKEADIGMIAYYFQKYKFDGLIIVGGFEAFISLHQLEAARYNYPAFRIPMVLIPATLSNNVPGTEYSLGSDTALNALMQYCDVVKQSAASTRGRVFVVDVQGGNSGYLATHAAIAVGAQISYIPEEGISLEQLSQDIDTLRESFKKAHGRGKFGKLILKSTNASKVFTTKFLADVITAEANGAFDAKPAVPGHVQQGGLSSPIDRTKGTKLAIRAVSFIESSQVVIKSLAGNEFNFDINNKKVLDTASVLGIKSSYIRLTSVRKLHSTETDLSRRMPKFIYWKATRAITDHLEERKRIVA